MACSAMNKPLGVRVVKVSRRAHNLDAVPSFAEEPVPFAGAGFFVLGHPSCSAPDEVWVSAFDCDYAWSRTRFQR